MTPKRLFGRLFKLESLRTRITRIRRVETTPRPTGPLTAEMMREMLGHLPLAISCPQEKWEWMAKYLNETLRDPSAVCPCCNVARGGELMDHLPTPPRFCLSLAHSPGKSADDQSQKPS